MQFKISVIAFSFAQFLVWITHPLKSTVQWKPAQGQCQRECWGGRDCTTNFPLSYLHVVSRPAKLQHSYFQEASSCESIFNVGDCVSHPESEWLLRCTWIIFKVASRLLLGLKQRIYEFIVRFQNLSAGSLLVASILPPLCSTTFIPYILILTEKICRNQTNKKKLADVRWLVTDFRMK